MNKICGYCNKNESIGYLGAKRICNDCFNIIMKANRLWKTYLKRGKFDSRK